MSNKTLLRLFRELRAAQIEDLVVSFDIETEPVAPMIAVYTNDEELPVAKSVPQAQERTYVRVVLHESVSYESTQQLKKYLESNFTDIERVVVKIKLEAQQSVFHPELNIYTKRKPPK